jgi:N-acyl-D-aspartate/D-glutamate deacylase
MAEYNLVVRGGSVVDGTGVEARTADVAVRDGVIVDVGKVTGVGAREIDADGALVTPGWVDIHTHYDAQATWDSVLQPSSWHGVTTVVAGNCGVGFAPVAPRHHETLIELMEGVEDIPGTALHEGLTWGWETFGEYLDVLDKLNRDIDIGVYIPHDPLRLYVMGERGAAREDATEEDIAEMGRLARLGIEQGALGFSTDRLAFHHTASGDHTPAFGAAARECVGIAREAGRAGRGALNLVSDFDELDVEFNMLEDMVTRSGMPLSFTLVARDGDNHQRLRGLLARIEKANARGIPIAGQVAARPIGVLLGLQCTLNPFSTNPVFRRIEHLSFTAQADAMRDQEFRRELLATPAGAPDFRVGGTLLNAWDKMFVLADPPSYEPDPSESIQAQAARERRLPAEIVYDILLEDGGRGMVYLPLTNYHGNLDVLKEMIEHPNTMPGLSDGGAHVGAICDASFPTTLLSYWTRDRERGRLEVPFVVQRQCARTASFLGLNDRGVLAEGYRADLNVIDYGNLRVRRPEVHFDLPAGGRRLMQRADGYLHTIVRGVETYRDGQATGDLPGRLVRGACPAPTASGRSRFR